MLSVESFDVSTLGRDSYLEVRDRNRDGAAFIVRDPQGAFRVFYVPMKGETYLLPDLYWYRSYVECEDFGPDNIEGNLLPDGVFRCRSWDEDTWYGRNNVWNYDGENLGPDSPETEEMLRAKFEVDGDHIYWRLN